MSVFTNRASRSVEQAQEYSTAVVELLGGEDPLQVLEHTPAVLRQVTGGLSVQQLNRPEAPGKWACTQVLQHLADSELVWGYRLRMVLAEERPRLVGYDQDLWAARLRYDQADAGEALEDFAVLRRGNLRLLGRIDPADLSRIAVHEKRGEETLEHMIRLYAGHDLLHLRQLDRLRRAVAGTP